MEKFKTIAIFSSIILNLIFGYLYFKGYVYQSGVNAGLSQAQAQFNQMVEAGQIIIPQNELEDISG